MNFQVESMDGITFFAGALAIVTTVFWMVVGWRAMRAHEALAASIDRLGKGQREST